MNNKSDVKTYQARQARRRKATAMVEEFCKIECPVKQIEWIIKNKDNGITLNMTDWNTYLDIEGSLEHSGSITLLDRLDGNSGTFNLLAAIGINVEWG